MYSLEYKERCSDVCFCGERKRRTCVVKLVILICGHHGHLGRDCYALWHEFKWRRTKFPYNVFICNSIFMTDQRFQLASLRYAWTVPRHILFNSE